MASQNYAFTYFDFEKNPIDYDNIEKTKYIIVGLETCPKTKKQHHQGYIQFEDKIRMKQAKERFRSDKIHIEQIYSKEWCNINYCSKDGNVIIEKGIKPVKKGQRNDIRKFLEEAKTSDELEMWEKYPNEMLRYNKAYDRFKALLLKKEANRQQEQTIIYRWGKTGSGKTRKAFEEHPDIYRVDHGNADTKLWFDGYTGQKTILFDDFRSSVKFSYMLELLDRYPMQLQVKFGYTYKNWNKVIITSNIPPEEQYPNLTELTEPFIRRITKVEHMDGSPKRLAVIDDYIK